jgi:hypothetical protein
MNTTVCRYNSDLIKEEHQTEWATKLRDPGNFAKHAKRDPNGEMNFSAEKNLGFIVFAFRGLVAIKVHPSIHTTALTIWLAMAHSEFLTPYGEKAVLDRIPIKDLVELQGAPKQKFLQAFLQIAAKGPPA